MEFINLTNPPAFVAYSPLPCAIVVVIVGSPLSYSQCDMSHLMNMRKAYKEDFEKKHGIKLGFMSCFVKASADALREMPAVNGCEFRFQ